MTRQSLLLTAVATVAIPSLLAMVAVWGQGHVRAEAGVTAALDGAPLSGWVAAASATAPTPVRDVAGVQQVSGAPVTVLSRVMTGQRSLGLRMLNSAASASLATSYQGTEWDAQAGVGGSVTTISRVWHQDDGRTWVETSNGAASATTQSATAQSTGIAVASSDPASGSPEGVFGVTAKLMTQLGKHYFALYWGTGSVAGRSASVVELYRPNGSLAARYWLDNQTMVPLRRELFDTSGKVTISDDSFVQIRFGRFTVPRAAATGAALTQQAQPAWTPAVSPSSFLKSLTAAGWQVPAVTPGGLPLYAAASTTSASGEIVDLEYSDGLYDISLFVQRGTLSTSMPGWRQVNVAGRQAFVSGHSVTWAGTGFVYTVIADAPPQTVTQVVQGLPGDGRPSILDRFGRGFIRLARLVNPFG